MTAPTARCPGACNAAARRAQHDHDQAATRWDAIVTTCTSPGEVAEATRRLGPRPEPPALRWTAGEPVWCPRDATAIRHALTQLSDLAAMLAADVAGNRGPAGDGGPVSGSPSSPSPSPAVDVLDEILRCLEEHEGTYRRRKGLSDTPARPAELRVDLAVAFLLRHLTGALAVTAASAGEQLGRDVVRLHRLARARTHSDEAKRRMPVPCPRCDLKALTFKAGDTYVACESCGRLMLLTEYEAHVVELARSSA